jgi:EAL domain-containing protein (putative c-di-GMP-specific phosphodiesterase class I)
VFNNKVAADLISAFDRGDFVLYGQDIVPIAASGQGPLLQEVLIRYLEEEEKLIPPGTFIPLLEENGLMPHMDRWVLRKTLEWHRARTGNSPCEHHQSSVNLSRQTINDDAFVDFVCDEIADSGLGGNVLCFEIPIAYARRYLERWRQARAALSSLGCRFAIAGLSSVSDLNLAFSLGATFIKADGHLVGRITNEPASLSALKELLDEARSQGLVSICERVETPETKAALRDLGPDYAQGFEIHRPMPLHWDC